MPEDSNICIQCSKNLKLPILTAFSRWYMVRHHISINILLNQTHRCDRPFYSSGQRFQIFASSNSSSDQSCFGFRSNSHSNIWRKIAVPSFSLGSRVGINIFLWNIGKFLRKITRRQILPSREALMLIDFEILVFFNECVIHDRRLYFVCPDLLLAVCEAAYRIRGRGAVHRMAQSSLFVY
jgi:hypothetical protein